MYLGVNEQKFLGNGIACFPPQGALLDQSISDLTAVESNSISLRQSSLFCKWWWCKGKAGC